MRSVARRSEARSRQDAPEVVIPLILWYTPFCLLQMRSSLSALRTFAKLLLRRLGRDEGLNLDLELARNILVQSDRLADFLDPVHPGTSTSEEPSTGAVVERDGLSSVSWSLPGSDLRGLCS